MADCAGSMRARQPPPFASLGNTLRSFENVKMLLGGTKSSLGIGRAQAGDQAHLDLSRTAGHKVCWIDGF